MRSSCAMIKARFRVQGLGFRVDGPGLRHV